MESIMLGEGELNWFRWERITDRYGAVHLETSPDKYAAYEGAPVGAKGTLIAHITETRQSMHIGDVFRGVGPSSPEVGDAIELGTGTLFTEQEDGITVIGVKPDDDRDDDWMDPGALYRCHSQTVRLEFVPASAEA